MQRATLLVGNYFFPPLSEDTVVELLYLMSSQIKRQEESSELYC